MKGFTDLRLGDAIGFGRVVAKSATHYTMRCSRCGTTYLVAIEAAIRGHRIKRPFAYCGRNECIPAFWLQRLRRVYRNMLSRCYNERSHAYGRYGGRGITVCDEWLANSWTFVVFGLASGWRPGLDIDRKDNDLGYTPENVRFVSRLQNVLNRRVTRYVEIEGIRVPLAILARQYGYDYNLLRSRLLAQGWPLEKALAMNRQRARPRKPRKFVATSTHSSRPRIIQREAAGTPV